MSGAILLRSLLEIVTEGAPHLAILVLHIENALEVLDCLFGTLDRGPEKGIVRPRIGRRRGR